MNRKLIWIVTICMGLAVTALIVVQAYWIRNAVLVKTKLFNQLVGRSLIDITNEVERREAVKLVMQQVDPFSSDSIFIARLASRLDTAKNLDGSLNDAGNTSRPDKKGKSDFLITNSSREQRVKALLMNRRIFVDRIIASMFLPSPDIEKRIKPAELEDVMQSVFKESGIDLNFEYAVTRWNNEVAFHSTSYNPGSESEVYKVKLFPDDIYANSNYLNVYFPDEKGSHFKSLGYMVFASLILSLLIVISFMLTTFIMFRQKRLSEVRNDFVSNMTHELKTPISTISLASQMLNDKTIPPESKNLDHLGGIIADETRKLGTQVEKVLQTAVFEKGKMRIQIREIDMFEIIESVVENFNIMIKSKNGKITSVLKAQNHFIEADAVHITNVLSNLVDNAIKYCSRNPEIRIEAYNKGHFLVMEVADNGIGISKYEQKKIFDKFYRVATGNIHTVKGFGLGLSYVKMIVEEHHGFVEVESELYEGSKFRIFLPLK